MNILIFGIDHEIQRVDAFRSDGLKTAFKNWLRQSAEQKDVQFIGEEALLGIVTVGAQLTQELHLPVPWRSIDMPPAQRMAAGILEEQQARIPILHLGAVQTHLGPEGFYLDLGNGWHTFCPRVPSDSVREDYMFARTLEFAGSSQSSMVLCGNLHVEELASRFLAHGDSVVADAVYKYGWYNPNW